MEPWEKLFQNLRATRATELVSAGWPEYKVCAWLGHTEAVAKKHYWQVTDEDYCRKSQLRVHQSEFLPKFTLIIHGQTASFVLT